MELKYYLKPTQILKGVITENNYLSKLTLYTDSYYAIANIKKLIDEVDQYNTLAISFAELMRLLKKSSEISESEAAILDEKENVVKVLTIHKSKGLEFPIVILGGLGRKINLNSSEETGEKVNTSDEKTEFSLPKDNVRCFVLKKLFLKIVKNVDIPLTDKEKINITLGKDFSEMFDKNKYLEDTEILRLMYVAITRPKEMLIPIIAAIKNKKDNNEIKNISDLFMKFPYETRDIIMTEELDISEIEISHNENQEKEIRIEKKQLKNLMDFAYKKYIAPTYIINELKKQISML
ncbi:UvrD-like helicase C-terminal domain-containing protein [Marinitoga hydrogenitolerans DSM 16785]|uniref:UvrD-like helicase C-terminal domain-containing protein n=1 Tax=Marinitoga hydrogenitolerans (strain DSM 16785 / JCM 12826 / AT1271) TaxID=1122195 RepID=A0A1M5AH14_MARH1|nr:UvrD-like helicase C-terminal domain-containing protein [Marinitoga hydrogenitolerans DSM 16785]